MLFTRRDFGKIAAAGLPLASRLAATPDSRYGGVQVGAISYSFREMSDGNGCTLSIDTPFNRLRRAVSAGQNNLSVAPRPILCRFSCVRKAARPAVCTSAGSVSDR
jgi:hypothetical protein